MFDGESMQQEYEYEFEDEYESLADNAYEGEDLMDHPFREGGAIALSSEGEDEDEYERSVSLNRAKVLARRLSPILRQITPIAVRTVGTAVGGSKVGNTLGNIAKQLSRESVYDYGLESEFEDEFEGNFEDSLDGELELGGALQPEALAEALAVMASQVSSEAEAEAYVGALTARVIPVKSPPMQQIYPRLVRGTAALTRVLRRSPTTRPLVKTLPTIAARAGQKLARHAAQGKSITPTTAARVMAGETKKVLGNPMLSAKTLLRSLNTARKINPPRRTSV